MQNALRFSVRSGRDLGHDGLAFCIGYTVKVRLPNRLPINAFAVEAAVPQAYLAQHLFADPSGPR